MEFTNPFIGFFYVYLPSVIDMTLALNLQLVSSELSLQKLIQSYN
jgi:hypothetical protein